MFEKNLKYYRLKNNMTKKELAAACGVTPMAIAHYESGDRKPSMETIEKLADALGIYVADFLSSRKSTLVFEHKEFRKNSSLKKEQQEYIKESVEEYFSRFFDAVDCIGGDPLVSPPKCNHIKLSDNFNTDALNLRKHLSLQENGPIDEIIGVLENKGIMILEVDINSEKFSGMNGFVNEYPYIVINGKMRPERKRTTIVHELAHLMFKWDDSKETENEKRATQIAGAFLIPDEDLVRELGEHRYAPTKDMALICEEYGISMYLLVTRASQAGIMAGYQAKNFYINANKANWKKNEPNRVKKSEEPTLFKQLVYRAINEEGISIQRGAELLKMPCAEITKYCGLVEV